MKYFDIKTKLSPLKIFTLQDLYLADPNFRQPTLYDWLKKDLVIQLRKNRYVFGDFQIQSLDLYLLANKIYYPSYVSLELGLNHYGIIPETVTQITSVTTRKTQVFTNQFATFSYQTINPQLFFGFKIIEGTQGIQLATLEKTLLDYLYLHPEINNLADFDGLRWNKQLLKEKLDQELFEKYLNVFDSLALANRVEILHKYLGE